MTKVPVDEAPAGPEIDAAVAEALDFEIEWSEQPDGSKTPSYLVGKIASGRDDWIERPHWRIVPSYSTDIAAAWELAPSILNGKHLVFMYTHWTIWHFDKDEYNNMPDDAIGETAPLAICRAFLKANGIEHLEIGE